MSLALSMTASRLPFQTGFCLSVQMTCQQKGGTQTIIIEDVCDRMIADLPDTFFGHGFSNLTGTEVGMLKFVMDYFVFVFLC